MQSCMCTGEAAIRRFFYNDGEVVGLANWSNESDVIPCCNFTQNCLIDSIFVAS